MEVTLLASSARKNRATILVKAKSAPSGPQLTMSFEHKKQNADLRRRWLSFWIWCGLLMLAGLSLRRTFYSIERSPAHHCQKEVGVPVKLATVRQEDFPLYLDGLGTVQAYNSVLVNARVSGQIQEIRFREGGEVHQGDVLAVIDPRVYQAQYHQAVAKKQQDEAQLENARVVLERDEKLLSRAVIDQQTYDTQKYLVVQLQATVQADQANLESQQTQLEYTQVIAPISGRAGVRQVDVGNLVTANSAANVNGASSIVVINQIQPIFVTFTLPQQDLPQIRDASQQNQNLLVIVLDRNHRTILSQGTLAVVDNQIDSTTATIRLKAVFENKDYHLWPGQFVNVRLLIKTSPNAIVVPAEAVQLGPNGPYVYIVNERKRALMRSVVIGPSEKGDTLITSGLKPGEKVVTEGQYRLEQNALVIIESSKSLKKDDKRTS
ncbi:MAG: efflux RND transporter periplasmic adaptor subunit [Verrucomicrobia bacterium]|nr:MAG: efflux RND transporter periplasmic adaptor subunit [Verrucomicrobiota bacterium]